eukprot:CAMPEP_0119016466 /NCGR_PEP_ID=MMETSP1176-20130426/13156_1 /TAXON_ID=265551 /ORGANISM="Synedropsis recta cf, Strain CCMP1620" /LENGTH=293 /DNA_ID=CAMNT_0006969899 /DNA_START=133 /DNA_END=1011 /DNA_ORIENTATION=+
MVMPTTLHLDGTTHDISNLLLQKGVTDRGDRLRQASLYPDVKNYLDTATETVPHRRQSIPPSPKVQRPSLERELRLIKVKPSSETSIYSEYEEQKSHQLPTTQSSKDHTTLAELLAKTFTKEGKSRRLMLGRSPSKPSLLQKERELQLVKAKPSSKTIDEEEKSHEMHSSQSSQDYATLAALLAETYTKKEGISRRVLTRTRSSKSLNCKKSIKKGTSYKSLTGMDSSKISVRPQDPFMEEDEEAFGPVFRDWVNLTPTLTLPMYSSKETICAMKEKRIARYECSNCTSVLGC